MATSTVVSSKYQIVIPKEARERIPLRPGQKLAVIVRGKSITLVPVPELEDLVGILRGKAIGEYRDEEKTAHDCHGLIRMARDAATGSRP